MKIDEFDEIYDDQDGTYPTVGLVDYQAVDEEVAEYECENCCTMRSYRAVFHQDSYRAFSVCFNCDDAEEF